MIKLNKEITPKALNESAGKVFTLAAEKVRALAKRWKPEDGSPVFTRKGLYQSRGWTEWTQGFQFGSSLLVYEALRDPWFLEYGRKKTRENMAVHVSHTGVHDHGFNNISTYGNLLRFMDSGILYEEPWERLFYEFAIKMSGAVQASRWTDLPGQLGYIASFNGPHSLFADTIRSLRVLALSHLLGHVLMGEQDKKISLLRRLLQHAETTARYNVYFGEGRDRWDVKGRVAHESLFNVNDGSYRSPSSQQGYSPFTTWTRGLAWILLGFAEELEFLSSLPESDFAGLDLPYFPDKKSVLKRFRETSEATADFFIETTPPDGVPYWDTGAPDIHRLDISKSADPENPYEPVDSSAAAIAAQGLLRLGAYLNSEGSGGRRCIDAGLRVAETLMTGPYLSEKTEHEGLLLHSVYHNPNAWDYAPKEGRVPYGESCMWGDYHLLELAVYIRGMAKAEPFHFFPIKEARNDAEY